MVQVRFMGMNTTEVSLKSTTSTMEAAKELAVNQDYILVSAETQSQGKGTRGRNWESPRGNIYMTVGIHRRHLPPSRLALMPLEVGLHLWSEAARWISEPNRLDLKLKWPNDLMLHQKKTAGILMELQENFLFVGIGVNISIPPEIKDGGSDAGHLAQAGMDENDLEKMIRGLYERIQKGREDFFEQDLFQAEQLLIDWQAKVEWKKPVRLRDRPGQPWVKPESINPQGHLYITHENGHGEWLIADYLL